MKDEFFLLHAANRKTHLFVWSAICALALALASTALAFKGKNVWSEWPSSNELRKPVYTEVVYAEQFIRTRANTWSNFAYVVVGLYAISYGVTDWRRASSNLSGYVCQTPMMSFSYGLACCYLGFGSGLFHASLTRLGQQIDVAAMYAPLLMMIAIQLESWFPRLGKKRVPTWPALLTVVIVLSGLLFYYKWSMSSSQVLVTLIAIVLGLTLVDLITAPRQKAVRWLVGNLATLTLAVVCRQLDVAGRFSIPQSLFQGHAFWHLLTAASLGCMVLYYRAQPVVSNKPPPNTLSQAP